ncbi:phenylalanine--tRNA ligase beta subunit-related protein [Streptomyces sp. NPDC001435]|uniref:phenylalanine--tRNA ligase beta subunit-related protein n=1 Tax=unclassified Streptomyces TaxID=2593676 RepID=UPI00369F9FAD
MRISLAWLERECGGPVDPEELLDGLRASGARAALADARAVDVEPPPELAHLASVRGLAAEIRARHGGTPSPPARSPRLPDGLAMTADEQVPGRVAAAVVRLPGPVRLPADAADRLRAAGVRLTGTVADLIAYVALETGQPLGAADARTLDLTALRLRTVSTTESVTHRLPSGPRPLPPGTWVLSAGDETPAVLGWDPPPEPVPADGRETLVWAWWLAPEAARRADGAGPEPDAVAERGVRGHDPETPDRAVARLGELVTEWAGGTVSAAGRAGRPAPAPRVLRVDAGDLCRLVDPELDRTTVTALLTAGEAAVRAEGDLLYVTVGAGRPDLDCVAALAGDAARVRGYRTVPRRLPPSSAGPWPDPERLLRDALTTTALRRGLQQVVTPVLLRPSEPLTRLGVAAGAEPIAVRGRAGLRDMRVRGSLLPGLLGVAGRSLHQTGAAQVFELGQVPLSVTPHDETWRFAVVLSGASTPASLVEPRPRTVGFADLTGLLRAAAGAVGQEAPELTPQPYAGFVAGASFAVRLQGGTVGRAGLLSEENAALLDAPGERLFCAELDLTALGGLPPVPVAVRVPEPLPLPAFNVTVVVPEAVSAGDVLRVVAEAGRTERARVTVKDLLRGGRVPAGQLSLTVRAEFAGADAGPVREERRRRREAVLRALGDRGWSGQ